MLLVKVCKVLKVRRWHALARQVVGLADTCWCGRVVGPLHMPKDTAHKQTCAVYFAKVFGTSITAWAVIQTLNTLAGKSECQHVSVYVTVCLDAVHFRFTAPCKYTCGAHGHALQHWQWASKRANKGANMWVFLVRVSMRRHMHAQMQGSMHNMYTCAYMQLQVWHWFLMNLV